MKNKAMAALAAMVLLFGGFTGGFFLGRNTRVETIQTTKTVHETVPGETVVVLREVLVTLPPETVMPTVPPTEQPVRSEPVKQTEPKKSSDSSEKKVTFPVNINTASKKELDALPGIGEVLAQRIIDYRSANGPFSTVDELTKVKGIGVKTLEKLKPYATV
jgi:competence protein ComEA